MPGTLALERGSFCQHIIRSENNYEAFCRDTVWPEKLHLMSSRLESVEMFSNLRKASLEDWPRQRWRVGCAPAGLTTNPCPDRLVNKEMRLLWA